MDASIAVINSIARFTATGVTAVARAGRLAWKKAVGEILAQSISTAIAPVHFASLDRHSTIRTNAISRIASVGRALVSRRAGHNTLCVFTAATVAI